MAPKKLKTSLTLSFEAVEKLDAQAKKLKISRSKLIEALARYGKLPDTIKKLLTEL